MLPNRGKAVVTGVAGFIGSHLAEQLLALGWQVIGIDCFTGNYPRHVKEANLIQLLQDSQFQFCEGDLVQLDLRTILQGVEVLFHEAGQPGVRTSWGDDFAEYVRNNILATQRLLQAVQDATKLKQFVFASSSSVYGDAQAFPTLEDMPPKPVSPYGVTKLACEHLIRTYHHSFGIPAVILRYFTAFGPRQRPDMAFHRFIAAALERRSICLYGNGEQSRDFTYVSDIVQANLLALNVSGEAQIFNIGAGNPLSMNQMLQVLEDIIGRPVEVCFASQQKGDVLHTYADISKASKQLGYAPRVSLSDGLKAEVDWMIRTHLPISSVTRTT